MQTVAWLLGAERKYITMYLCIYREMLREIRGERERERETQMGSASRGAPLELLVVSPSRVAPPCVRSNLAEHVCM